MGLTNSEKASNNLNASVLTVVWLFIFILCSTLHSLQVKKIIIGNVTINNYCKKAYCLFCASLFKERFFSKGFDPEIYFVAYGN